MYQGRIKKFNAPDDGYWREWPTNNCPYIKDINWAASIAVQYLDKIGPLYRQSGKKGIVVFDLDDTLVQGDPENIIGIQEMLLGKWQGQTIFLLPPQDQIVKIAEVAKKHGFTVVVLTARPPESKMASVVNLKRFSIVHDHLIMNDKETDPWFKIKTRRQMTNENQHIVLTIGDQWTDVVLPGPHAMAIKLPDADSKCCYAYVP